MEIDEDQLSGAPQPLDLGPCRVKGTLDREHDSSALQIENAHRWAIGDLRDGAPLPWRSGRIIQRPQEARLPLQQRDDFLLIPEVVAGRDDIDAAGEDFLGGLDGNPGTAGSIFTIGNHQTETVLLPQFRNEFLDRAPARLPDDVGDKEHFHAAKANGLTRPGKRLLPNNPA